MGSGAGSGAGSETVSSKIFIASASFQLLVNVPLHASVNGQLGHGDTAQRETPAKVEALDLLRQGIAPAGDAAAKNAAKKRPRTEQDDMRVPSQKPHDADFAAVPDS